MKELAAHLIDNTHERVCAMIVTYNRRDLLRGCILALQGQTRPVDEILIVDNASADGTREMLETEFPACRVLRMTENTGASGGYYAGTKWSYDNGFDWTWIIDDEGRAAPDCLEKLMMYARPNSVVSPVKRDAGGRLYGFFAWQRRAVDVAAEICAAGKTVGGDFLFDFTATLISRRIVEQIGLPNKDFIIWFDDFEYAFRVKSRTDAEIINVPAAMFHCNFGANTRVVSFLGRRSYRSDQPAWKTYYGVRNPLYFMLRSRRKPDEITLFLLVHTRLLLMDVIYEPDRWRRVKMRFKGIQDAVLGRMGMRVRPS